MGLKRNLFEVDFVCNQGHKRYYTPSAYALPTDEKMQQEVNSLIKIKDGFIKFIIVETPTPSYQNEEAIVILNIYDFLMNENSLTLW